MINIVTRYDDGGSIEIKDFLDNLTRFRIMNEKIA